MRGPNRAIQEEAMKAKKTTKRGKGLRKAKAMKAVKALKGAATYNIGAVQQS